jgi:hypothetical protein
LIIIIIVVLVYCSDGNKAECGPGSTGMTPATSTGNSLLPVNSGQPLEAFSRPGGADFRRDWENFADVHIMRLF